MEIDGLGDGQNVEHDEDYAQDHGEEHDAEARGDANDFLDAQLVLRLDDPEEVDGSEDPPGIAAESLVWPGIQEELVYAMEVGKVCVNLEDPVRLGEDDGANEEVANGVGKEGLDLHPGDDIVQRPRGVEEYGGDRQPPGIDGAGEEEPEALP